MVLASRNIATQVSFHNTLLEQSLRNFRLLTNAHIFIYFDWSRCLLLRRWASNWAHTVFAVVLHLNFAVCNGIVGGGGGQQSAVKSPELTPFFIVSTTLEFAAFGSGPDAKYSRASAFCFFSFPSHVFCSGPNTYSPENTLVFISIELQPINSWLSTESYRKSLVFVVVT